MAQEASRGVGVSDYYILPSCLFAGVFDCHNYLSRGKIWNNINLRRNKPRSLTTKTKRQFVSKSSSYGITQEGKAFEKWKKLNETLYVKPGSVVYCNHTPSTLEYDDRFGGSPDSLAADAKLKTLLFGAEFKNPEMRDIPTKISPKMVADVLQCVLCMEIFKVPEWHLFYYKEVERAYSWFIVRRNERYFRDILYHEAVRFLDFTERPSPPPISFQNKWATSILENIPILVMGIKTPERQ